MSDRNQDNINMIKENHSLYFKNPILSFPHKLKAISQSGSNMICEYDEMPFFMSSSDDDNKIISQNYILKLMKDNLTFEIRLLLQEARRISHIMAVMKTSKNEVQQIYQLQKKLLSQIYK